MSDINPWISVNLLISVAVFYLPWTSASQFFTQTLFLYHTIKFCHPNELIN